MNQQSKSTKKSNIYFVTLGNKKSKNHCSENMLRAYNKCLEYDMQPVWISKRDSDKMKFTKFDTLVVEKCENTSIRKLTTAECCIIDPDHFPSFPSATPGTSSPVCTEVMRDLCICTSRLCFEDKIYVQALVSKMSGNVTTELDDKVTHLVTSTVLSVEYEKALYMKIQIVTKEWIKAIWEANMTDYVKPDDKRFDKYKVPIFYNLVVTSTNIQRCQKEEVERLIKDNGGVYMSALDCEKVNIVLAPENSHMSQKLKYAREANIICLTLNWLYESITIGYALPFRNYIFQTAKERFSRKSNVYKTPSYSTSSFVTYDKQQQQNNYIDEAAFKTSTMSNVSTVSTVTTILDRPAFNEAELAGPFLYGCIMYLAGFASDQRDKLKKILTVGSAMRFDYICDILTHVIVGDEHSAASELKLLKSKGFCPYILRLEWLEESIRLKRPAPENNFLYEEENCVCTFEEVIEPSSSLDMNLQLQERTSVEGEESSNFDQQNLQNAIVSTTDETVQEYIDPYVSTLTQMPESFEEHLMLPETNITNDGLFEGLTFVVSGFSDAYNYVVKNIIAMNGKIVPGTFVNIPDYAIVPTCGMPLQYTVKEIVTDLFIDDCINQDRIVEIMYYHRPISVAKHVLSNCVLTVSTYVGVERSYLITLAMELGAIYQNIFAREDIFERDLYRNTHLICPIPEGKKYDAAIKWDILVVTAEWLKACAAQSIWINEMPFLVIKSSVPSKGREIPMEINRNLLQTNTNQIVLSTQPVASSSRSHNIIVPEEYFPNLEIQNNNFGNMLLLNNEFSLPMNTTSEPSETSCNQVPLLEAQGSQLEGISYSSNLRKEEPPSERAFSRPVSIPKKNWRKVNEKLPDES